MENKKKITSSGSRGLKIGIGVFSLVWFISTVFFPAMQNLNHIWDNLMLNFPGRLYRVYSVITGYDRQEDYQGNAFSFGKYLTKKANSKISIAAVDDYTIGEYGWPVPRNYYGVLVEKLNSYGAKGIVFDIILSKSKRSRVSEDRSFVAMVAKAGNVGNLVSMEFGTQNFIYPIEGLAAASAIVAQPHVDVGIDTDGQVRKYLPFWGKLSPVPFLFGYDGYDYTTYEAAKLKNTKIGKEFPELPIPSIGIAAYSFYTGKHLSQLFVENPEARFLKYRNFIVRKRHPAWDTNPENTVTSSFRHISMADIISGRLSKEEKEAIKDGILLVGSTAVGAFDHSPSPFYGQLPGVEVHATFLDNMIAGDFNKPLSGFWVTLLVLLLPWLPFVLRRYSLVVPVAVCSAVLLAMVVMYVVLLANCVLMPFATISLALFLPFAYITVDKGLAEGREKKYIKNTFGQYLSPKVVEVITKDPSKLSLGGEKREMTAFFLDIAGFTTMSEKLSPEELTAMLTNYLSGLTEVVLKHEGTVDKFIGDCIMAFWNAPLDQKDHRRLAVLAAVDCQAEMQRLNDSLTQYEIKPSCRVGLNTGQMVVGNMGSKTRMSYTVMGDAVNLASRLEGANKFFHSKIMVSEYTFEDVKEDFDYRFLGSIRVVGKAIPVKVYEPFARKGQAPADLQAMLKHYNAGIEKFYAGDYKASLKDFKAALEARPGDGPSQYYIETAEAYAKAPPKDWDKAFNLTSKG